MLAQSHHGLWVGVKRLWFQDPLVPLASDAQVSVEECEVSYSWSFDGEPQEGRILIEGPDGSVGAEWFDTWHADGGMVLHGTYAGAVLRLYGIYPAGNGAPWGWRIELELNDPERLRLRMFNLEPGGPEVLAVDLLATAV